MPINMQQLSAALEPVRQIGTEEITFHVGETEITLRLANPKEEVEAQTYARQSLGEDEEGERHVIMSYLDHVKVGYLSYAIMKLGDMDLRGVERIETGEKLENNKMVTVPRHMALRDLLWSWNRLVLVGMFKKYSELITKTQQAVEEAIEFEPSDIGAEIERLEERVAELKRLQEEENADDETTERLKALAQMEGTELDPGTPEVPEEATDATRVPVAPPEAQEPVEAPQEPPQRASRKRSPILPERVAPPVDQPVPSSSQPPQQGQAARMSQPPPPSSSSFVDSSDADAMQAEANAEHQRIMARRQRAAQGLPPEPAPASVLQTSGARRLPPHAEAAQVASTMTAAELKHQALQREYTEAGTTEGGVPMFVPPTEGIGGPSAQSGPPPRVPLNPQPTGNANPRFKRSPNQKR
jgi:hypothetical protein